MFDILGHFVSADVEFIASVTADAAQEYAGQAMGSGKERGCIDG